jgi:hypothetical protein
MALTYIDTNGTLKIPGAYSSVQVVNSASGLASNGIVAIFGEAESGNSYTDEDVSVSSFGPDQYSAVTAKYISGPLVDAYRAAANPSQDGAVRGAPQRILLVKTNVGTKALLALTRAGFSNYGNLRVKAAGALGNMIYSSTVTAGEVPATVSATFAAPIATAAQTYDLRFRLNGGAENPVSAVATFVTPTAFLGQVRTTGPGLAATLANFSVRALGGQSRGTLAASQVTTGTLAVAVSGNNIVLTIAGNTWAATPSVGDSLFIPTASAIKGTAANENSGSYIITAADSTTISATKLYNDTGTFEAPAVVAPTDIAATTDIQCFSPISFTNATGTDRGVLIGKVGATLAGALSGSNLIVTISTSWASLPQAGDIVLIPSTAPAVIGDAAGGYYTVVSATASTVTLTRLSDDRAAIGFVATVTTAVTNFQCLRPAIDGVSKTLEITKGASDTGSPVFFNSATFAPRAFSTSTELFSSSAEAAATITLNRQSDGVSETIRGGGKTVLKIGYIGTSCLVVTSAASIVLTPVGGSGTTQTALYKDFKTLSDLAKWINSKVGFIAALGSNIYGQLPPTVLDVGTYTAGTSNTLGAYTCRIKNDSYDLTLTVSQSPYVEFSTVSMSGLPDTQAITYFGSVPGTEGTKGGTSNANIVAALATMERLSCNFVVSAFSRDASSDIVDSLTDSASAYTIDAVNANVLAHVVKMSAFKRRRPRQGFVSIRSTFELAKDHAQNLASPRISCTFQDIKGIGQDGSIVQYQPWYGAALAAGFQAAAFYRPIFNKQVQCSGVLQAAGDFFDGDDSLVEDALSAGLLTYRARPSGGFAFVSDQTTYGVDNNFVYNSIQAIYAADLSAVTIAQEMENAFVGQSFADVSAAVALSYLKGILVELRRLKLITASSDAPSGYKNASITISAPSMLVGVELKLGTGIYFIPVQVLVSQVQQSA